MLKILLLAFLDVFFLYSIIELGGEMGGYVWIAILGVIWITVCIIFEIKNR